MLPKTKIQHRKIYLLGLAAVVIMFGVLLGRVRAQNLLYDCDNDGVSESATGCRVTIGAGVRIVPPVAVTVSQLGMVRWQASPHAGSGSVDGYRIYYKPSSEAQYPSCPPTAGESSADKGCAVFYPDAASRTDNNATFERLVAGLTENTEYDFIVRAFARIATTTTFDPLIHESRPDCESCEVKHVLILSNLAKVNFGVLARPEKRFLAAGDNYDLDSILLIYDPATGNVLANKTLTTDTAGRGEVNAVELPAGNNYVAFLKGRSHLARKLTGIDISNGATVELNFTGATSGAFGTERLFAGDVQGAWPGLKNNFVNILDVSAVDSRFNQLLNRDADLNDDAIVDVLDMSMTLVNFNRGGEALP